MSARGRHGPDSVRERWTRYREEVPLPLLPAGSVFEWGGIRCLPELCAALDITRPLLVTDRGMVDTAPVALASSGVAAAGVPIGLFADVDGNPRGDQVERGVKALSEGNHDGVIAVGGGSGLDAGKAIAFAAAQHRPLYEFAFDRHGPDGPPACVRPLPWIAVPTTAGTGSEVSPSAVVSDELGAKRSIMHPAMFAPRVLCDPELTVGLPLALTAWTGIDALTHCLEAFSAPGDDAEADGWALAGLARVRRALVRACEEGSDRAARTDMMAAALLGARAFRKGLGGLHALSHVLAARFGGQHGQMNAVLLPYVLAANRPAVDPRLARVADALSLGTGPDAVAAWIEDLWRTLDIPRSLPAIGIDWPGHEVEPLARAVAREPNAATNPCTVDADWSQRVLTAARAGDR